MRSNTVSHTSEEARRPPPRPDSTTSIPARAAPPPPTGTHRRRPFAQIHAEYGVPILRDKETYFKSKKVTSSQPSKENPPISYAQLEKEESLLEGTTGNVESKKDNKSEPIYNESSNENTDPNISSTSLISL